MALDYFAVHYGTERLFQGKAQLLDLKQMAEMEDHFRVRCREAIRRYKNWKSNFDLQEDKIERHYRYLEGRLLRHQAKDATALYQAIRKDFRKSLNKYIREAAVV